MPVATENGNGPARRHSRALSDELCGGAQQLQPYVPVPDLLLSCPPSRRRPALNSYLGRSPDNIPVADLGSTWGRSHPHPAAGQEGNNIVLTALQSRE
jgi:hypothetical protein